jgi:hypothetical protein
MLQNVGAAHGRDRFPALIAGVARSNEARARI